MKIKPQIKEGSALIRDFSPWIPEAAQHAFNSLCQQKMISDGEEQFIKGLFFDENLKSFWTDFGGAGYGFFSKFLYSIVRSQRFFEGSRNKPVRIKDAKEGLSTLQKQLKKIEKTIRAVKSQAVIEDNAFNDLQTIIEHCQSQVLPVLVHQITLVSKKPRKNWYRPLTRQSGNGSLSEKTAFYGRMLHHFFRHEDIQKDWKKSEADLNRHICDLVNVLLDMKDDPLTEEKLYHQIRNFSKKL